MENFSVDEKGGDVENAILHLYKNEMFTDVDVVFISENKKFPAHKLILALRSPVFEIKFYAKNRVECDVVYIESFKLPAVKNMISFFYDEPLIFENIHDIKETMRIAEEYKIKELSNICIQGINNVAVNENDLLMVLDMSLKFEIENKEKECLEIVARSPENVFASKLFKEMEFERVCQVFVKLREKVSLTNVQFLNSALKWMGGSKKNKASLLEKMETLNLSRDEFIDIIISYPDFFTSIEISNIFEKIKLIATDTEQKSMERQDVSNISAETETAVKTAETTDTPLSEQETEISKQKRKLIINILDGEDGTKQAVVTIIDDFARRSLAFKITGDLNEGKFASLSRENGEHTFDDVDISYEGLYFMLNCLRDGIEQLPPIYCSEVLKAAIYFELQNIQDACLMKMANIIEYDPMFLNTLGEFPFFEDRLVEIIRLKTKNVLLHPNFIESNVELIRLLLTQSSLNLPSEEHLLIATITWLEARNRQRGQFRSSLLNEIAFENLTCSDLENVVKDCPNFFTPDEINSILLHKKDTSDSVDEKGPLPHWFNSKTRNFLS